MGSPLGEGDYCVFLPGGEKVLAIVLGWQDLGEDFCNFAVEGNLFVEPCGESGVDSRCAQAVSDEGVVVLIEFGTVASKSLADLVVIHGDGGKD